MLNLSFCLRETCHGFDLIDKTGPYSPDNEGGYGPENGVDGPNDFDSYTLKVWSPGLTYNDDPSATINLLPAPVADGDGWYVWSFYASDLGLEMKSGWWSIEVVGVKDSMPYTARQSHPFLSDLWEKLSAKVMDGGCGCDPCGGDEGQRLFMAYCTVKRSGNCDTEKSQRVVDWLYTKLDCCK
jgi:hypothetical protein